MQTDVFPEGFSRENEARNGGPRVSAVMLCAAMALFLNAGCASSNSASAPGAAGQAHYIVTADITSFYKEGPAQPGGPDLRLKKDQVVAMVEKHYGYSKVIDPDGETGYVPTEDIAPAPAQTTALVSTKPGKTRRTEI